LRDPGAFAVQPAVNSSTPAGNSASGFSVRLRTAADLGSGRPRTPWERGIHCRAAFVEALPIDDAAISGNEQVQ